MTVGWFMDDEPSPSFPIYTRGNVGEVFPDPVSPLTASASPWAPTATCTSPPSWVQAETTPTGQS